MANMVATLGLVSLALAGSVTTEAKKTDQDTKIARAMAVAEADFELHRAQLGLLGSSALSEHRAAGASTATAKAACAEATPAPETPLPAAADTRR